MMICASYHNPHSTFLEWAPHN